MAPVADGLTRLPTAIAHAIMTGDRESMLRDLQALEAALDSAREAIGRELADIPPPVPACDVHFNQLLEDRGRLVDALQRLRRLRSEHASPAALASFLATGCALVAAMRRSAGVTTAGEAGSTAAAGPRR
jgi:hypothetical protein